MLSVVALMAQINFVNINQLRSPTTGPGVLVQASAGSVFTVSATSLPVTSFTSNSNGQFTFSKDSTHGVVIDVATDSILKLFARDGSSAANFLLTNGKLGIGVSSTPGAALEIAAGDILIGNTHNIASRDTGTNARNLIGLDGSNIVKIGDTSTVAGAQFDTATGAYIFKTGGAGFSVISLAAQVWIKAADGTSDTATVKANQATFTGLASVSGTRYVCSSTTGALSGSASACSGTDADAIASIPELRRELEALRAELVRRH